MAKQSAAKMFNLPGAIAKRRNIHTDVLETHSPSFNFIFGKGWGLPAGFTMLLSGKPKGGKSVTCRSMIGKLHQNDPEAYAIVFDTEFRWEAQLDDEAVKMYGIDEDRLKVVPTNHPAEIFDVIEQTLAAAIQNGHKIKLIIIDSISEIQGRRGSVQESIMTMQRGDHAATLQDGWKQILPTIRKNNIGLILTTQVRAEQDAAELMKHKTIKPNAAFGTLHFAEYSVYVEAIDSAVGRKTLGGEDLKDTSLTVNNKTGEDIGHRIRAKMLGSSLGPKRRVGEFTLHYKYGFYNTHEEIFTLGVGTGAIDKPTQSSYTFGDRKWVGSKNLLEALKKEPDLAQAVLQEVKRRDLTGEFKNSGGILEENEEGSPEPEEPEES